MEPNPLFKTKIQISTSSELTILNYLIYIPKELPPHISEVLELDDADYILDPFETEYIELPTH